MAAVLEPKLLRSSRNTGDLRGTLPRAALLLALVLLPFVAACGNGNLRTYKVSGKVLVDGVPAPYAFVILHPLSTEERIQQLRPNARADRDGVLTFTTYATGDGVPAGKYRVTLVCPAPPPGQRWEDLGQEEALNGPDRFAGRYQDPATSSLEVEITSSAYELPPIEVTSLAVAGRPTGR